MNKNIDLSKLSPAEQQEIGLLIAENKRLAKENLKPPKRYRHTG